MLDGCQIIMISLFATRKIKENGQEIYYQEDKTLRVIQILTMILEVYGHQARAM